MTTKQIYTIQVELPDSTVQINDVLFFEHADHDRKLNITVAGSVEFLEFSLDEIISYTVTNF